MKLLPLVHVFGLLALAAPLAQAQLSEQQLMSEAQTAFLRNDLATAKHDFQMVIQINPRNTVAANYLRIIQVQDAKAPRGNDQEKQLSAVIIPKVEFREATLGSAIDFLRQAVAKATDGKQSVNFVLNLDEATKMLPISLKLTNIPASEVIRYIGDLGGVQFTYEKYAISVKPKTAGATAAAGTPPAQ